MNRHQPIKSSSLSTMLKCGELSHLRALRAEIIKDIADARRDDLFCEYLILYGA